MAELHRLTEDISVTNSIDNVYKKDLSGMDPWLCFTIYVVPFDFVFSLFTQQVPHNGKKREGISIKVIRR